MAWDNPDLVLFHGTDLESAEAISKPSGGKSHSVIVSNRSLDFGSGFYLTTRRDQAIQWANAKYTRRAGRLNVDNNVREAAVVQFQVRRDDLARLEDLVFTDPDGGPDYMTFISHCRKGGNPADGRTRPYDVTQGPVCRWPNKVTFPRMDQICLHTDAALNILLQATIIDKGRPLIGR